MFISWASDCRTFKSFSYPLPPEAALIPLCPEAELTPLVVESVEIVLAALDPKFSPGPPILAKGNSELRISANAF